MYPVVFTPEAEAQLTELHRCIAEASSPNIAARFTDAIVTYCEGLAQFPLRGTSRDEIRPGLRTASYKKRTVIAFAVLDDKLAIICCSGRGSETPSGPAPRSPPRSAADHCAPGDGPRRPRLPAASLSFADSSAAATTGSGAPCCPPRGAG